MREPSTKIAEDSKKTGARSISGVLWFTEIKRGLLFKEKELGARDEYLQGFPYDRRVLPGWEEGVFVW